MFLDEFLDLGLNQDGTVPQLQYEQVNGADWEVLIYKYLIYFLL